MRHSLIATSVVLAGLCVAACGSKSPTSPTPTTTTLLTTSLSLTAGVNCNTGGASATFNGTSGRPTTVTATGSTGLNPALTLYAPDFATQIASAIGSAGRATLTFTLTQTGGHHITVCDQTGTGGTVAITVTQPG